MVTLCVACLGLATPLSQKAGLQSPQKLSDPNYRPMIDRPNSVYVNDIWCTRNMFQHGSLTIPRNGTRASSNFGGPPVYIRPHDMTHTAKICTVIRLNETLYRVDHVPALAKNVTQMLTRDLFAIACLLVLTENSLSHGFWEKAPRPLVGLGSGIFTFVYHDACADLFAGVST